MKPWKYFLHRSRQSGDILIAFAVLIPLLCALGGLTLDVGNIYVTRSRLQNATDSAVIAGAYQIGNSERVDQTVQEYLYSNTRQAYDSVIYGEKAPEAERTASYTIDASKQNELDIEDAISSGFSGLLIAVDKFDPAGFSAFHSYASMWITQGIQRDCNPKWIPALLI